MWQHADTSIIHNALTPLRSLEQLFCLLEEALAHGAFLAVAKVGVFLELGLLGGREVGGHLYIDADVQIAAAMALDRKSTRLNSSHRCISYAVFCLKKK